MPDEAPTTMQVAEREVMGRQREGARDLVAAQMNEVFGEEAVDIKHAVII